jgi:hypothetical protein
MHTYTAVGDFTFGRQWKDISPLADGEGVKMTVEFDTEPKVEFDNWQYQRHVVEELAANAGLMNVAYRAPDVGILHEMELEAEARFCQLILSHPPNEIMRAGMGTLRLTLIISSKYNGIQSGSFPVLAQI